ncbi:hypothetical protein FGG08_005713 [Glutinoglossum americanum]|uniref:Guanine nucleotide exchange factor synembryn n=1 Tax=Glutinoglossum americanum TaxID=1670608 RepID=A0A9P8HZT0_9PEZI|nr:hypothetical protein FGG08_005713 [Glutinoglossum americanum]
MASPPAPPLSPSPAPTKELTGKEKLDEVTDLMNKLKLDLKEIILLPHRMRPTNRYENGHCSTRLTAAWSAERTALLERVKVHGRKVDNADPIFTDENDNADDQFLLSRILFLTTYDTNINFERLIDEHHLADNLNQSIARQAKMYPKAPRKPQPSPQDDLALSENLKLIFNITHFLPHRASAFSKSIPNILKILCRRAVQEPPLQQPTPYLINALLNLDLEGTKCSIHAPLFPKIDLKCNAERLIVILDKASTAYPEAELDQIGAPLVTLLRKVYELAPETVKKYMQDRMLPSEEDRKKPLGRSDNLSSRLLNFSSSPMMASLRDSVSSLLFELSEKDATQFVENVGYGFASGFLMTHNLPVPESAMEAFSAEGITAGEEGNGKGKRINPITGQFLGSEEHAEMPEMTEEEKEREAEKLFVLFERLKKTGVVNVKNPVEQAVDEGRFEEID